LFRFASQIWSRGRYSNRIAAMK